MDTDLGQNPDAMERLFTALGLAEAGEAVHGEPLAGGVSSGIYRVDLRRGSYCVKQALPKLKVTKEWLVPVERVFSEIAYLRAAGRIVPGHVPRVVGEDQDTKSFVMEFLGADHRNWKAELLAGRIDAGVARDVGDVLGRIHAATADSEAMAMRFATDENFHAIRLEPYLVETARVHPDLAEALQATVLRTATTRRVLVHGDVSPKNILLGPGGPVLLDAECAWFGDPAFDLAFCLNHFLLKTARRPDHGPALRACHDALLDAYRPHVRWESATALDRRVALLLPGLALARVDGKSPVEYLDGPQRARVRETAVALLRDAPETTGNVATHWMRSFRG
jgi:aminoglycoside phosphotransferase (APT) family kinase protein